MAVRPTPQTGTYGTATLTTATGVVSYALDNADPDTNALPANAHVSDNFTVYVKDGSTGTASTAVNFAITGTNDAPVVAAVSKAVADTSGVGRRPRGSERDGGHGRHWRAGRRQRPRHRRQPDRDHR